MINQISAFSETLAFARERGMDGRLGKSNTGLDYAHLVTMFRSISEAPNDYDEGKLGHRLGWAQAAVVAAGCGTLDDMKKINTRNKL